MKKSARIALPLLLIAVVLITALSVFTFTATAADTSEATLTVATINYGTDATKESNGYEISTTQVSKTTGSFAELAATLADLAPEVDTRYTLKLNKDVTVDTAFTIAGNEHTEVWIDFGGNTVTSTVDGTMMTAAGSGASISVWGDFTEDGSYGRFVTAKENGAFAKIAAGSTDRVDVKYVDATFSGNAADTAMFVAEGGKLVIQHSVVTHTSGNAVSIVDAKNAAVDLKYSDFWGDKSATLVSASASKVYIEGGEMIGAYIVVSDETASSILMTGFACEVDTGFIQGSADTKTYILGANMEIYTAIATGAANADNLVFYYGDGTTSIVGQDPSEYGLGNTDCSYTLLVDTWTMVCSSTEKALATVATVGQTPATEYYSTPDAALEAELGGVGIDMRGVTDSTVRVVTLVNDYTSGSTGCIAVTFKGCRDASVIFDLNGHTNAYTSDATAGQCLFNVSFDMHFTMDGADAAGNVGSITTACRYAKIVYARQSSSSGQINYHLVTTIKNVNIEASALHNASASGSPVLWLTAGYSFIDNVKITYTGTTTATMAATSLPMLTFGHTPFPKGVAFVNGLTISSTSQLEVPVYGMNATNSWRVFATNYKTDGVELALNVSGSNAVVRLENANIKTDDVVFAGAGKVKVYDSTITTATGALTTGSVMPTFYYGTGKTVVNTSGNILSGNSSAEEGYGLGPVSDGVYKLISDSDTHTITMPAVFSSGMMLQRNKVANVYGYCQDVGATIRVIIGDQTVEATVGEDGKWKASFAPMDAAYGVRITIKQLGKGVETIPDIAYEDVNIGEIWVTSGQSNASLYSGYLEDLDELALLSETLNIREFTPNGYCLLPDAYGNGSWDDVTASVVREKSTYAMSALGYATVAKLSAELGPDVPVGLVTIAQGSTKIMTWMDYEQLSILNPSAAELYDGWVDQNTLPSSAHGTNAVGTVLYNRHVYPLEGFTTAGVIWYQGCGDITSQYLGSSTYTEYFTSLELIFRRAFGNGETDLPFYVMQLAPYSRSDTADGTKLNNLMKFKYQQYDFCQSLENTYLVSLGTEGMAFTSQDIAASAFIHPARKSPLGIRTADMILANEYGIKLADVVSHPMPVSAVRNADGTVTVTFDTDLKLFYGDEVIGFQLTNGSDWYDASATIDGNKLILSAAGITATGVRYGYGRIQIELRDGTVIEVNGANYSYNSTTKVYSVTDAKTGTIYEIDIDSTDVVRTMTNGNITNASGIPLVLFSMDVAAG